jgi:hypothetical protein
VSETTDDLGPYLNSLYEDGASRAHGAWIEGHQDVTAFMFAVRDEYKRLVGSADVRTGYYRVLRGVMHFTTKPGRGATPVTWTEW